MEVLMDTLPYQLFKKMKERFATKMILITPSDLNGTGVLQAYENPQEYVTAIFRREGYEVIRYRHNYKTIEGEHPELGLVFMANDSVVVPGMEVWGLIGHNIRPLAEGESKYSAQKA